MASPNIPLLRWINPLCPICNVEGFGKIPAPCLPGDRYTRDLPCMKCGRLFHIETTCPSWGKAEAKLIELSNDIPF